MQESSLSFLQTVTASLAAFLVLSGLYALVAAWTFPNLLDTPVMRWLITGKRLAPTRANRTLTSVWAVLIGSFFLLSLGGYRTLSYIAFAAWLPLALIVLKRTFWPATA